MGGMGSSLGMQMTGGSNMGGQAGAAMDPRFSLGPGAFDSGLGLGQNSGLQSQHASSYNRSPSPAPSPAPAPGPAPAPNARAADVEPSSRT
ncbi:hypothetical protein EW145_g7826 [Phellinidium pouzarii]|uniref:Uncharacterized protein n=1 Tax=Phellinidium pouzarii TaxID=167371 RepID=A0A4S4KDU3_9AGAM|nr:hypothetical protein EW145_g7826 [Phellinidium pouzarii]